MPLSDRDRAALHELLDELLDEVEADSPATAGILLLREVIVQRGLEVERYLCMRGVFGKDTQFLRDVAKRLQNG